MTYFLSLVTGSNFSPRLSGGATPFNGSGGGNAFASLLGAAPMGAPAEGAPPAGSGLPTAPGMNALLATDAGTGAAQAQPGIATAPTAADGKLGTVADPAATEQMPPADDAKGKTVTQSTPGNKPDGEMQAITPKPVADASPQLDKTATETEGEPEEAVIDAQPAMDSAPEPKDKEHLTAKDVRPVNDIVASLPPSAAAPVEAAKLHPSQDAAQETSEPDDDASLPAVARKDKETLRSGAAQLGGRATPAPAQPAADGTANDFARHIANDGGDGASSLAAATGSGADHNTPKAADTIRMPSHTAPSEAVVSARAGQIGKDLAVEIAKHSKDGRDSLTIRLDPAELGRIHVRMHFDDQGSLRAHVSAESNAALDMLRRDSQDLARALGDAGVRTDGQSFRFDGRGQDGSQHGQRHTHTPQHPDTLAHTGEPMPEEPAYRRVRASGGVDLFA
ncbi:flagellar hook-length control protein FliK [Stakelama marina]|uniref:Flagellar hook-length control protein FliK n=1 Tax=Stakelama marina TaxID=2826939 RepID=A0A8T4I9C1_9SPHN|nr:flagellar hook-length control protein FliK [Stakelama marina]MBR0550933.1 flagellar hook-length control protein FliK [Stakelama marina]